MKKKWVAICLLLMLVLTACSSQEKNDGGKKDTNQKIENTENNTDPKEEEPKVDPAVVGKTFASGDYEYTVQEDGTAWISTYTGSEAQLTLPTELDGYQVSGVWAEAFGTNDTLQALIVPGQIKSIGDKAFNGCGKLQSVTLEEGVESIGNEAFFLSSISEVNLPDSICHLESFVFPLVCQRESNGLFYVGDFVVGVSDNFDGHVVLEPNTKGIADLAFYNYDSIYGDVAAAKSKYQIVDEGVEFPEGMRYIGQFAFLGQVADKVRSYKIPSSVEEIGEFAIASHVSDGHYAFFDEFSDGGNECKVYVTEGSAAEEYAKTNGLNYVISKN